MGMKIKDPEVEGLVKEVAALMGVNKKEAIRQALEEKKRRLSLQVTQTDRRVKLKNLLEREIWTPDPEKTRSNFRV